MGAGNAGQLLIREIQRNRALAYTPIGFVDDDPSKKKLKILGVRVLGTTDELPRILAREPAGRGADRDAVRAGRRAPEDRRRHARRGHPGQDAAGPARADRRRRQPRHADPRRCRSRTCSAASRSRSTSSDDRRLRPRPRPCSSPAPAARSAPSSAASSRASACSGSSSSTRASRPCTRSSASSSTSARFAPAIPVLADCGDRAKMRHVFERYTPSVVFHAAAYKHVPMLEANPLQAVSEQRARDARDGRGRGRVRRRAVRADLDRQGGERRRTCSASRRRSASGSSSRSRARDDVETRFVAVRFGNVLGSSGSVIPIFRRQIERGGPVTVTAPGDDALLHDDPGGGLARRPGRLDGRQRPGVRARHGRAGQDRRPRPPDDRALGPDRGADRDRVRRRARRREAARGALERGRGRSADRRTRRSCAPAASRSTAAGSRTSSPSSSASSPRATRSELVVEARRDDEGAAACWRSRRRPRRVTASRGSRRG